MTRKLFHWLQPALLPVVVLLAWQAATAARLLDPLFFPPPSTLASTTVEMIRRGDLWESVRATLARAAAGFLIGTLAGIACGAAMGISRVVRRALEPAVSMLYSLPKLTLLPMLMLLVGVGEGARLLVIAVSAAITVAIHTLDGVRGVGRHYVEMASNAGATPWMIFRRVYLPASAPQIFTGVRLACGRAMVITVTIEMVSANSGLGNLIWTSWQTFSTERLYVAVFATAVIGSAVHQALRYCEHRLVPWRG